MGFPPPFSSEEIFRCPWWVLKHDRYALPDSPDGKPADYYYLETHGSVMIVPVLDDGRLVLLKQYRYLVNQEIIEFPGGGVGKGEDPQAAAERELEEEAGYRAATFVSLGKFLPYNGVAREVCEAFLATGLEPARQRLEQSEQASVLSVTPLQLDQLIADEEITDGMTLAALYLVRPHISAHSR